MRQTSIIAYNLLRAREVLADREYEVFQYLLQYPNSTDQEITDGLGQKDPNYVRPRRKSLCDCILVIENGKRKCQITGMTATIWKVVKKPDFDLMKEKKKKKRCLS